MAFDDMTAFGAIRALAKAGLRVPDNCSVIGFDDVAACSLYTPPLTTIRQPMEAMGAMAANLVVEGINEVRRDGKSQPCTVKWRPTWRCESPRVIFLISRFSS
jgi:LacI family transcriptional regulator